jgi:hypothetical protein
MDSEPEFDDAWNIASERCPTPTPPESDDDA